VDLQTNYQTSIFSRKKKKMAAAHFSAIPCEPIQPVRPCTSDIVNTRFEDLRTFLCAFISVV